MSSIVPRVEPGRIFTADGHKLGHTHVVSLLRSAHFLPFLARAEKEPLAVLFLTTLFLIGREKVRDAYELILEHGATTSSAAPY